MKLEILVAFFGALLLGHSFFLSVLCFRKSTQNPALFWLGILLFVLILRLSKPLFWIAAPEAWKVSLTVILLGGGAIGPALWAYVHALNPDEKPLNRFFGLNFLPSLLPPLAFTFFSDTLQPNWFFGSANCIWLLYLAASYRYAQKNNENFGQYRTWLNGLFIALSALWCTVLTLMWCVQPGIALNFVTTVSTVILYGFSWWAADRQDVFTMAPIKRKMPDEELEILRGIGLRVAELFEKEKSYTDTTLSIQKLAGQMRLPPYRLSKAVNHHFNMSFPELLMRHRIRETEYLLRSTNHAHLSIETIAYNSGFASLSAFYAAFKKIHGVTPAAFQRRQKV
jgi:AraC-like DNA-binding protein